MIVDLLTIIYDSDTYLSVLFMEIVKLRSSSERFSELASELLGLRAIVASQ